MSYIGSGQSKVDYQLNNTPVLVQEYTLYVSEDENGLFLKFEPVDGTNPPVVGIDIEDFQPDVAVYDASVVDADPMITANFYSPAAEYICTGASVGHVHLAWVATATGRTYSGYFSAYNMDQMGGGSPLALKFSTFSFDTSSAGT